MKLYSYWRSSSSWRVRLALGFKGIPVEIVDVLNGIKVNKEFANKHRALEYLQNIEFKVADARVKNPKNIKLREPTLDTILRRCNSDNYPGWKLLKTKRTDSR